MEFVNLRAVHTYPSADAPDPTARPARAGRLAAARVGERPAYFAPAGFVPTPIYERARLPLGAELSGPAIVEQADTTTVVPPGWAARVDESGNLLLRRSQGES